MALSKSRWESTKIGARGLRSALLTFKAIQIGISLMIAAGAVILAIFENTPVWQLILCFLAVSVLTFMLIEYVVVRGWMWIFPREGVSGVTEVVAREGDGDADRPRATPEDLQCAVVSEKTVYLSDVIDDRGMVIDKRFIRCNVYGPAIIRPAERRPFHNCMWVHLHPDQKEHMFYEDHNEVAYGTCRTTNTSFIDCNLFWVAFMLKASEIKSIWAGYYEDTKVS